MSSVVDLSELSVYTALSFDDVPVDFMDDLFTAPSIEDFEVPASITPQFFIGLSTEEDGDVKPIIESENKLCYPLKNVNMCVSMATRDSLISIHTEARDSGDWSILAQARFRVGGFDGEMKVVDGDVFRFGPYAQPVTVRIGDPSLFRLAIELRYIYQARIFDFDIVSIYSNANSLIDFDEKGKNSIKLQHSGRVLYPDYDVMAMHNLREFGRGNADEYFPQMTIELRNELAKKDLRSCDMLNSLLCFLHPPHQPVQQKFIRPLIIFARVHRMVYLLNSMENALIMEPPATAAILLDHFRWGEKWGLTNLIRTSLLRAEGSYREAAESMINMPDYAASLSLGLRQAIADRMHCGWSLEPRMGRLAGRIPTSNVNRIVYLKEGRAFLNEKNDLHTFAEVHSSYAFGSRH